MKKLSLFVATVLILLFGFYLISNKDNGDSAISQQETASNPDNISWEAERISDGSNLPTYGLTLIIGNKSFNLNDYWKEPLYGCRDFEAADRPADTVAPSDSISDQLCYFMAGGDLFYVVQNEGKYQILHKQIIDGFLEQSAIILLNI